MSISEKELLHRWTRGCIRAYLDGKKTKNWISSIIKGTGIRGKELEEILEKYRIYAIPERYKELITMCKKNGWL